MDPLPSSADVAVIGAGPAGTAAASILHAADHSVCVLEKARFPRFVIGESLLPRCMDLLEAAGLMRAVEGRGYIVKHGATFLRGDERSDFDFADQHHDGWGWTWQVPRADFDLALADAVQEAGVPIFFEHAVEAASFESDPVLDVRGPDGQRHRLRARHVIDASGYGRVLPRLLGLGRPSGLPVRQALFTHVRGDRRPEGDQEGRIWLCVHPDGAWIWIIPFSDGRTSVGVVAEPSFFEALPEDPAEQLRAALGREPNCAARLADATFAFEPVRIGGYSVGVERLHGPGFTLVGNATEFLDPIFSSGVTLALESSVLAAEALVRQLAGEAVDWDREYARPLMAGVGVFRACVEAWYEGTLPFVFFSPDPEPVAKRQICSVLAGYVWDETNPYVQRPKRQLARTAQLIRLREEARRAGASTR